MLKNLNLDKKKFREDLCIVLTKIVNIKFLTDKLYNFQELIDSIRISVKFNLTKKLKI